MPSLYPINHEAVTNIKSSLLLSLGLIMSSLHELRDLPNEGDYFLSFDDLLEAVRDASVKSKFSFKLPHKTCPWMLNARINKDNDNEIIIEKVVL